jgi:hypothetical protein
MIVFVERLRTVALPFACLLAILATLGHSSSISSSGADSNPSPVVRTLLHDVIWIIFLRLVSFIRVHCVQAVGKTIAMASSLGEFAASGESGDSRFPPKSTALLLCDFEHGLLRGLDATARESFVSKAVALRDFARKQGWLVAYTVVGVGAACCFHIGRCVDVVSVVTVS